MLNLFVWLRRHFDTGSTLVSQTVEEFITDDTSKEIFDQCDVKQVFELKDVSEPILEYSNSTLAEL